MPTVNLNNLRESNEIASYCNQQLEFLYNLNVSPKYYSLVSEEISELGSQLLEGVEI